MGDVAKGIKAFKKGMTDEETAETVKTEPAKSVEDQRVEAAQVSPVERKVS
jgi:sec-independent protein translocase protein TatA